MAPEFVKQKLKTLISKKQSQRYYKYDIERFRIHSNSFNRNDNPNKLNGIIAAEYHAIEKGLTMPDMRFGFGLKLLTDLVAHCELYAKNYNSDDEQFTHAVGVIKEYFYIHNLNGYSFNESLQEKISNLLAKYPNIEQTAQNSQTKKKYFKYTNSQFDSFSKSRHSIRNYSGPIERRLIEKAIKLSLNTPSACNRQPTQTYIIENADIKAKILELQSGNRGFGHLADKLIIVTGELGVFLNLNERNDVYVNGGMFAMNLLYALHFYKIGACTLNWCSSPSQDMRLREVVPIKASETVVLLIACGDVPDEFSVAISPRIDYMKIINYQ